MLMLLLQLRDEVCHHTTQSLLKRGLPAPLILVVVLLASLHITSMPLVHDEVA